MILPMQADAAATSQADPPLETIPDNSLLYVSDYFSFVGQDKFGHVAFAIDNNRGRDGNTYQAEHFLVLHDEQRGWIDVAGNGSFPNLKNELSTIPDSSFFRFSGRPRTGMTITSDANHLILTIEPIPQRTSNRHEGSATWMGSAPAVLTWNGRMISGRVIYEYFMMPGFNRLTRTYWGMWKEFQGLYLLVNHTEDLYVHSQLSERIAPLVGKLTGFAWFNDPTESLPNLKIEVLDREWSLGFYRWPKTWRITWNGPKGPAILTLTQFTRKALANWVSGGFSMSIVRGKLDYAGTKQELYGFAELIM